MSQFIKEFGIVDEQIETKLFDLVRKDESKFETSKLYSSEAEEKFIDVDQRSSRFRLITNKEAFDVADSLIEKINKMDKTNSYILFRNNITHISYQTGDFFKAHEDYLSITSNEVEEYTMILCMSADCDGGETIFHVNDFFRYESKSSVRTGHCLLFRKDLKHEGAILKSGTKDILTFNVWGVKKSVNSIVAVTFNANSVGIPKFFISTSKIFGTGTLLESFVNFASRGSAASIFLYEEKTFTPEQFEVIHKLYNKMYITPREYKDRLLSIFNQ